MKRFVHDRSTVDMIRKLRDDINSSKEVKAANEDYNYYAKHRDADDYSYLDEDDDWDGKEYWMLVDRKDVQDWDGFYTKYSMYRHMPDEDYYVCVFGDPDLYRPEDGDFDAEFDNEEEAYEWFESYRGAEDDEDDIYGASLIDVRNTPEGRRIIDDLEEAQEEIRGRGLSYDDESEFWVRRYKADVKKLKDQFGYHWDEK